MEGVRVGAAADRRQRVGVVLAGGVRGRWSEGEDECGQRGDRRPSRSHRRSTVAVVGGIAALVSAEQSQRGLVTAVVVASVCWSALFRGDRGAARPAGVADDRRPGTDLRPVSRAGPARRGRDPAGRAQLDRGAGDHEHRRRQLRVAPAGGRARRAGRRGEPPGRGAAGARRRRRLRLRGDPGRAGHRDRHADERAAPGGARRRREPGPQPGGAAHHGGAAGAPGRGTGAEPAHARHGAGHAHHRRYGSAGGVVGRPPRTGGGGPDGDRAGRSAGRRGRAGRAARSPAGHGELALTTHPDIGTATYRQGNLLWIETRWPARSLSPSSRTSP